MYFYGDGCANGRIWGIGLSTGSVCFVNLVNDKLRNSLACTGHSDCGLKQTEIELL